MNRIFFLFLMLIACNSFDGKVKPYTSTPDFISNRSTKPPPKKVFEIDSVKMHGFDDLYFGTDKLSGQHEKTIGNLSYSVSSYSYNDSGIVYKFILYSHKRYLEKQNVQNEITRIKNIINKKYSNIKYVNKVYRFKSVDELDYNTPHLDYYEKMAGKPLEHLLYQWDTEYKIISLSYRYNYPERALGENLRPSTGIFNEKTGEIDYKKVAEYQSRKFWKDKTYFVIEIEFKNKLLMPSKASKKPQKKEWEKF